MYDDKKYDELRTSYLEGTMNRGFKNRDFRSNFTKETYLENASFYKSVSTSVPSKQKIEIAAKNLLKLRNLQGGGKNNTGGDSEDPNAVGLLSGKLTTFFDELSNATSWFDNSKYWKGLRNTYTRLINALYQCNGVLTVQVDATARHLVNRIFQYRNYAFGKSKLIHDKNGEMKVDPDTQKKLDLGEEIYKEVLLDINFGNSANIATSKEYLAGKMDNPFISKPQDKLKAYQWEKDMNSLKGLPNCRIEGESLVIHWSTEDCLFIDQISSMIDDKYEVIFIEIKELPRYEQNFVFKRSFKALSRFLLKAKCMDICFLFGDRNPGIRKDYTDEQEAEDEIIPYFRDNCLPLINGNAYRTFKKNGGRIYTQGAIHHKNEEWIHPDYHENT